MYSYRVFGGHLKSEFPFPELRSAESGQSSWSLRVSPSSVTHDGAELLGSGFETYCRIELYRIDDHLRLYHSCTGSFDILNGGHDITWSPAPSARIEAARADVFGRVLAVAMHVQGILTLHASAVAFETGAVAFIAPKGHGKSTLAMALTSSGARLVTDDMLPIRSGEVPTVMPGVQTVRLRDDSANRLYHSPIDAHIGVDGKHVIHQMDVDRLLVDEAPLKAIYVLSPVKEIEGEAVTRSQLSSTAATMSLVAHMKVASLLGRFGAATILDRATAIARVVPVYKLHVARDIDRLTNVVETICEWHQASALVTT